MGTEFEDHIITKHYLWNYMFYIYQLKKKDDSDYNGIETYIMECYDENEDIGWFPVQPEDLDDDEGREELFKEKLSNMKDKIAEIDYKLRKIKR